MVYDRQTLIDELHRFVENNGKVAVQELKKDSSYPSLGPYKRVFGSVGAAIQEAGIEDNRFKECPCCGEVLGKLGSHWEESCEFPEFSDQQWKIIQGVLLGDGCVPDNYDTTYSLFQLRMVSKPFIEWFADTMDPFSCTVRLDITADESAEEMERSGLVDEVSNAHDVWSVQLRSHPAFSRLRVKWYDGSEKIPPRNQFDRDALHPTIQPEVLRYWYVSDGGVSYVSGGGDQPVICTTMYDASKNELRKMFNGTRLDPDIRVRQRCNEAAGNKDVAKIGFDRYTFFSYIGDDPVPGFEYKWATGQNKRQDMAEEVKTVNGTEKNVTIGIDGFK